MRYTKKIKTDRLILRPFRLSDAADFFEYARDPSVGPNAGWAPHKNLTESKNILKSQLIREGIWAIVSKEDKKVIGSIGLHDTAVSSADNAKNSLELGYALSSNYWGKGYMTEAATAVMHYAFSRLNVDVLWCGYFDYNTRSRRVCEKLGFAFRYDKSTTLMQLDGQVVTEKVNQITKEEFYALHSIV